MFDRPLCYLERKHLSKTIIGKTRWTVKKIMKYVCNEEISTNTTTNLITKEPSTTKTSPSCLSQKRKQGKSTIRSSKNTLKSFARC